VFATAPPAPNLLPGLSNYSTRSKNSFASLIFLSRFQTGLEIALTAKLSLATIFIPKYNFGMSGTLANIIII